MLGGPAGLVSWGKGDRVREEDRDSVGTHDEKGGEKRGGPADSEPAWSRVGGGSGGLVGGGRGSGECEEEGLSAVGSKKRGTKKKGTGLPSSGSEAAWLKLTGLGGSAFAPLKGDEGTVGGREERDGGEDSGRLEGEERDGGGEPVWGVAGGGGAVKTGKHGRKGKKILSRHTVGRISKVRSPFGEIHLYVRESERGEEGTREDGDEVWPVFADDEAEPLVQDQLNKLLELATGLQVRSVHTLYRQL